MFKSIVDTARVEGPQGLFHGLTSTWLRQVGSRPRSLFSAEVIYAVPRLIFCRSVTLVYLLNYSLRCLRRDQSRVLFNTFAE